MPKHLFLLLTLLFCAAQSISQPASEQFEEDCTAFYAEIDRLQTKLREAPALAEQILHTSTILELCKAMAKTISTKYSSISSFSKRKQEILRHTKTYVEALQQACESCILEAQSYAPSRTTGKENNVTAGEETRKKSIPTPRARRNAFQRRPSIGTQLTVKSPHFKTKGHMQDTPTTTETSRHCCPETP